MIRICFVLSLSLSLLSASEPELRGSHSTLKHWYQNNSHQIRLISEVTHKVKADQALILLGIQSEDDQLEKALIKNQTIRDSLVQDLVQSGIAQERVVQGEFSNTPRYGLWGKKPRSYQVEHLIKVTILNEKEFRVIAEKIDTHQQLSFGGIEFKHSEEEKQKEKVFQKGILELNRKKDLYEKGFEVRLQLLEFNETKVQKSLPMRVNNRASMHEGLVRKSYKSPTFLESEGELGELVFNVSIEAVYRIVGQVN